MKRNSAVKRIDGIQTPVEILVLSTSIVTDRTKVVSRFTSMHSAVTIQNWDGVVPLPAKQFSLVVVYVDLKSNMKVIVDSIFSGQPLAHVIVILPHEGEMFRDELRRLGISDILNDEWEDEDMISKIRFLELNGPSPNVLQIKKQLHTRFGTDQFVGRSREFQNVIEQIVPISESDSPTFIYGESGTGKEYTARAIHYLSNRSTKPFLPINCGAIPELLFENEMFGHERGAYTGATHLHRGLLAEDDGGTLFLDEINTLSIAAQVKLLRFMEDKIFRPLGASKFSNADVRIIAATNIELEREISAGRFREDLYYRINVLSLRLPALRERACDIPLLANHFLGMIPKGTRRHAFHLCDDAMMALSAYHWPGNIRELKNVIERAVVLARSNALTAIDMGPRIAGLATSNSDETFQGAKDRAIRNFEKEYLLSILKANGWNISRAAKSAQKDRRSFQRLIRKHGIQTAATE